VGAEVHRRRRGTVVTMKILVVADYFPWPPINGGLMRMARTVDALADMGELDLFSLYDERSPDRTVPPGVRLARLGSAPQPAVDHSLRWRAEWMARRGRPMEVVRRRSDSSPRRAFDAFVADHYDLVWCSGAVTYDVLGRPRLGPTVVDFIDLEGEKERQRAALTAAASSGTSLSARAHRRLAVTQARVNARDWMSFERSVADAVDRVVLSSDLDQQRSGIANATVVDNTYPRPEVPVGSVTAPDPPTLLFQGTFDYLPNADGARWLVGSLLDPIRSRVPGVQVRLVGLTTPAVEALHAPPTVTVVGRVPAMEPELARADLAVVPVRYGGGTRLKILESFAHRVPVVSTTVGAEGLDVEDGVHLLLADEPDDFALACERLLTDAALRSRVVDAAHERYLQRYESSVARQRIRRVAADVAGGDGGS